MKREHLLLIASTAAAVAIALGLLRWLAPQLLGLRADWIVVQSAKEIPPFFEGVFRGADFESPEFLIQDPITSVRGHPLLPSGVGLGPHDLLGFRNHRIPNVAEVVVIGDSQTYGNNARLEENWPSRMAAALPQPGRATNAMATGGWGAVQYLDMTKYAATLRPRVLVVAYYTGNDALEAFKPAYTVARWSFLRPDARLAPGDLPAVSFPAPASEQWKVRFADGVETVFTPRLRLATNDRGVAAVEAGYAIMGETARLIADSSQRASVRVVFTVIPTKEFVHAVKLARSGASVPPDFTRLIAEETRQIERFVAALKALPGAVYADVIEPLQQAALGGVALYPADENGHPVAAGYEVIGRTIAAQLAPLLRQVPLGPAFVAAAANRYTLHLVTPEGVWLVPSEAALEANGWSAGRFPTVDARDIAVLPLLGVLTDVDPQRFGPAALRSSGSR